MNAPHQTSNQNLVHMEELMERFGVDSRTKLANCLDKSGIKYFGEGPKIWTTLQAINKAVGIGESQELKASDYM